MLKYLTPSPIFLSMSQKLISAFFKPPQGKKRKQDDHDDETKNNHPDRTSQLNHEENNVAHSNIFHKRCRIVKELSQKRNDLAETVKMQTLSQKIPEGLPVLNVYGITYDEPLSPMEIANNLQERIHNARTHKEKQKNQLPEVCESPNNLKKSKEESAENDVPLQVTSEIRCQIIALSKINPALSANIGLTWFKALSEEFHQEYFKELGEFLKKERAKYTVYPPEKEVYFWTNTVKIHDVKVIILGQDPYHGPNQAHGLAFSVRKGVTCPPSLKNIYKELANDIPGFKAPSHGYLYGWASQGVLLLNATLTVRAGCPNSHKAAKWNHLTDAVIRWIDQNLPNSVFMLWGKNAQEKMSLITKDKHLILASPHPSPFSADKGFFGCQHFSKANEFLKKHNKKPIDWNHLP